MAKGPEVMNAMVVSTAAFGSNYNSHHTKRVNISTSTSGVRTNVSAGNVHSNARPGIAHPSVVRRSVVHPTVVLSGVASTGMPAKTTRSFQLTRRGRLVLLGVPAIALAAVVVLVSMAFVFGSMASPAHASAQYPAVDMADYARTVTVLQGGSLWSIAAESDPNRDVREVVSEIVALNELGAGVLQAGQQLFVPLPK